MNFEALGIGLAMVSAGLVIAVVVLQLEIRRLNDDLLGTRRRLRTTVKANIELADVLIAHLESEKAFLQAGLKNAE